MKKTLALLLALAMVVALGASAFAEDVSKDPKVNLIFTANALSSDWHGKAMQVFADKVAELSGGSVTCDVYSDSTLFSSENEWDAINTGGMAGGADIAYISFQTLSTQPGLEWCEMIGTAYFWNSYEHMTSTLNGEVGQQIYDKIAAATGVTPINAFYLGSRVINTRNKPINSISAALSALSPLRLLTPSSTPLSRLALLTARTTRCPPTGTQASMRSQSTSPSPTTWLTPSSPASTPRPGTP